MDELAGARARADAAEERLRSQTLLRAEAEHRLKTSLAIITGWAATLEDRWDDLSDERRRDGLRTIRRASEALADEASSLLDDARAELQSLDAAPVRLDVDAVLSVTTARLGGLSDGHAVVHVPATSPVEVEVDPAALQQVLGHLVENAVKYSAPGTKVTVAARANGSTVLLEVRDEGMGVPADVDLFAPFRRGAGTDDVPGVGLGLYVVRNLCRAMGGDVRVRPNDGPGSTFTVELPAAR